MKPNRVLPWMVAMALWAPPSLAGVPGEFVLAGKSSGGASKLTLNLDLRPATADVGKNGVVFVAAFWRGAIVFLTPSGWVPATGAPIPLQSGVLATGTIPLLKDADVAAFDCAQIYAGYGTDYSSMLANRSFGLIYGTSGASNGTCDNTALAPFNGLGAVEGYLYSGSGGLQLSPKSTPPSGTSALSGATVAIGSVQGTTDSTGYFSLRGVLAGGGKLKVTGATSGEFGVTVVSDTLTTLGTPSVSRQQAIELVKAEATKVGKVASMLIMGSQNPLPTATRVRSALKSTSEPLAFRTLPAPSWLFWVDFEPYLAFGHATAVVTVDAETGAVQSTLMNSWPSINGSEFYRGEYNKNSDDLVSFPTEEPTAAIPLASVATLYDIPAEAYEPAPVMNDHVAGCTDPKTYALLVRGYDESDSARDVENIKKIMGTRGLGANPDISEYLAGKDTDPVSVLRAKFTELYAKMRPCDTFFLYISAHATKPNDFTIKGVKLKMGGVQLERKVTPPVADDAGTADEFSVIDAQFEKMPACHLYTIVDACYSGAWIPEMKRELENRTGLKAFVFTSTTDAAKSVGYKWWWPTASTGGWFTTQLTSAWQDSSTTAQSSDPPELSGTEAGKAFSKPYNSYRIGLPGIIGQKPQFWIRNKPDETCGCSLGFSLTKPTTEVAAAFTNGTGSCGANTTFNDTFSFKQACSSFTMTESNGSSFTGTIDDAGNVAASRGGSEQMSVKLQTSGSGTGSYAFTNAQGCKTVWQVTFTPK
ncbi:peptidase associated/transthyretin-like domain-containing protein [Parachitinimonas caeni]|uniref:Caspase domain-containing protein n=1 Tax=Parachitinimonas caeni TaxID=3031301 RepID=A0ABT7DXP1_9NEIS|nr:hypothetical protein [Parachitinimonas caeni]MDK2124584.1 hypothetical protein [Parachitinimonas caeni]